MPELALFFIDLIITAIAYLTLPIVFYFFYDENYQKKTVILIVIINAVVIFALFSILNLLLGNNRIANVAATVTWSAIGYYILKKKIQPEITDIDDETPERYKIKTKKSRREQKAYEKYVSQFSDCCEEENKN